MFCRPITGAIIGQSTYDVYFYPSVPATVRLYWRTPFHGCYYRKMSLPDGHNEMPVCCVEHLLQFGFYNLFMGEQWISGGKPVIFSWSSFTMAGTEVVNVPSNYETKKDPTYLMPPTASELSVAIAKCKAEIASSADLLAASVVANTPSAGEGKIKEIAYSKPTKEEAELAAKLKLLPGESAPMLTPVCSVGNYVTGSAYGGYGPGPGYTEPYPTTQVKPATVVIRKPLEIPVHNPDPPKRKIDIG
jgi:hypothetical protein